MPKIKISRRYPMPDPKRRLHVTGKAAKLRAIFLKLKRDESFLWPNNWEPLATAKQVGIKVVTRKLNGTGYRIWRAK